ncbi:MAG: class I SAM-dependent methyltransferase [Bacteroidota bacterium]|nr:class I SAM-dependent methyltransferase [Bacteroidota bacterium]
MNEFDTKAREWDKDKVHLERAQAIAEKLLKMISPNRTMTALEYGAGTGLLSFALKDYLGEITLMDNSQEMIQVACEKIAASKINNMQALRFDLEHDNFNEKFDIIYNQMVLHHISDIGQLLDKFNSLLKSDGYLAIADLYSEDGSFHGEGFAGHNGFDVEELATTLREHGFKNIRHQPCFLLRKSIKEGLEKEFPIFLMVAEKSN